MLLEQKETSFGGLLTAFQTRQYSDQLEKATEIYHKDEHVLLNQADG
jgi:hypothetical protein